MAAKNIENNEMMANLMETQTKKISDKIDEQFENFAARLEKIE